MNSIFSSKIGGRTRIKRVKKWSSIHCKTSTSKSCEGWWMLHSLERNDIDLWILAQQKFGLVHFWFGSLKPLFSFFIYLSSFCIFVFFFLFSIPIQMLWKFIIYNGFDRSQREIVGSKIKSRCINLGNLFYFYFL